MGNQRRKDRQAQGKVNNNDSYNTLAFIFAAIRPKGQAGIDSANRKQRLMNIVEPDG
jgi:hypothetical protein